MAADANIFAQFMRPVKSVADYGADMDARETNKLALVAARMKAQQDQQTMTDEQTFRGLAQQHGDDQNALMRAAMGAGLYGKATGIQKTIDEQAKAKADLGKTGADTRKTEAEVIDKSLATAKTFVNQIQDAQGAAAYLEGVYADPVLGPLAQRMMPKDQAIAQIPQEPQQLLRWKAGHMAITGDKLIELLKPKTDITNMGGAQSFGSTDQFTGQRTQTGSAPITESANNVANNARMAAEGAANRGVQMRGQNMLDARAKDATAQASKAPAGYRYKPDGTMEAIPGGPADLKNTAATSAKVTDAQDVLSLLGQAAPLVEKATGSYAGYGADQAARVVGQSTEGSRAAAQLKVLEGSLISKMPKMSGPQSDKDVLLYKQMAGQIGDPTIPRDQKVAAMQTIREINERHAGGAPKPTGARSAEDAQAREWATKNPNDPRAKQIMQRLGGG